MRVSTMFVAVGLSLSLATLTALAQPGPGRGLAGGGKLFEKMDANGDGLVSEEESRAFRQERRASREARVSERAQGRAAKAL
ncbi:MAG: hypothetical protein AAGH64_08855, partial [Planctomycetota bacterium]